MLGRRHFLGTSIIVSIGNARCLFRFFWLDGRPEIQWWIQPSVWRSRWMWWSWTWGTVRAFKTIVICPGCRSRLSQWRVRDRNLSGVLWRWLPDNCPGCKNGCRAGILISWHSFLLHQIHHSNEFQKLHLIEELGNGRENHGPRIHWYIWVVCWTLMCYWNLVQWWLIMDQMWQWNVVRHFSWMILWWAGALCWVGTRCWLQPGRLIHAWRAGALCCARSARLLHKCDLRLPCRVRRLCQVGSLWRASGLCQVGELCRVGNLCRAVRPWRDVYWWNWLLRHVHSTFFTTAGWSRSMHSRNPMCGRRHSYRKICWTTSTPFTRLLRRSRITRQVSTAGGLAPWQGRGCRLGHWTAIPVLSTRPPWRPRLSHWIAATRAGRSCRPGHWIPFPASVTGMSWGMMMDVYSMVTAVAMGRALPFRRVSRRTTVAAVTVPAPFLIPGAFVMLIRGRLSSGRAIELRWADHLWLYPTGTTLRGWFVGLGLRFVMRSLVRLPTSLFLQSQGLLRSVDFNTIINRFLQLFGSFPLELLRLGFFVRVPILRQPWFTDSARRLSATFMAPFIEPTLLSPACASASTWETSARILGKMNADHVSPPSCNTGWTVVPKSE